MPISPIPYSHVLRFRDVVSSTQEIIFYIYGDIDMVVSIAYKGMVILPTLMALKRDIQEKDDYLSKKTR